MLFGLRNQTSRKELGTESSPRTIFTVCFPARDLPFPSLTGGDGSLCFERLKARAISLEGVLAKTGQGSEQGVLTCSGEWNCTLVGGFPIRGMQIVWWGVSRAGKVGKHGLEWDKPGVLRIPAVSSVSFFSSVAQSCLTLQTHELQHTRQLAELTQTHVCSVGDTIQPSHLLLSPSPPAFNLSQHQGLF